MCNLNKRTQASEPVHHGRTAKPRLTPLMSSAPKVAANLEAPVVCKRCKTAHYQKRLACKNCGDYFHNQEPEKAVCPLKRHPRMVAMAVGAMVALVAMSATMLHIL